MLKNLPNRACCLKLLLTLFVVCLFALAYLDAWLMEKLAQSEYAQASKVYAKSVELYDRKNLSRETIIEQLRLSGYRQGKHPQHASFWSDGGLLHISNPRFSWWDGEKPAHQGTVSFNPSASAIKRVQSSIQNGYIRILPIEIGRLDADSATDRIKLSFEQIPKPLIQALLATEDRGFYQHIGVSPSAILRALYQNLKAGHVVQGGSTITQQLAKNYFLTDGQFYWRKIIEAIMALLIEVRLDKEAILTAYVNEVFVAQDGPRAIHGFGLASQYLFGQPINQLNLSQAALLVAMLKGPSRYNPVRNPELAIQRRNLVLQLMQQQGFITADAAQLAQQQTLKLANSQRFRQSAPAYLDLVKRQLKRDYSQEDLSSQGLRIFTHLDPIWQQRAQTALSKAAARLNQPDAASASPQTINGAVVTVDFHTGDVLAVVGDSQPRRAGFNRALDARRQIGSLIKPAVVVQALQQGISLNQLIDDSPLTIATPSGPWQPENFDQRFHGQVSLYQALAQSYNVAFARLANKLGVAGLAKTLRALGVQGTIPEVPALSLGAVDLSPIDVAQMYATIASDGFYTPLKSIHSVRNNDGQALQRVRLDLQQRFKPSLMYQTQFAMQAVIHDGTAKRVQPMLSTRQQWAGKTGTSSAQRDSWFAGFNRQRLSVVWLGNDSNQSLALTGSTGALPIWAEIMRHDRRIDTAKPAPKDIQHYWIDRSSGLLSRQDCDDAIYMPISRGNEPKQTVKCTIKGKTKKNWFLQWFL
ncbi:MAG: transglycosylase domain-containing protein [Pseudomonadales bacterium]|nr:transglycosylase domain-containing protein [Pseudomonadales bacterium]